MGVPMSDQNSIGRIFPSLSGTFPSDDGQKLLNSEIDWTLPAMDRLVQVIRCAFNSLSGKDLTQMSEWAESLYRDIVEAKKSFPGARSGLDVMQLDLAVSLI